MRSLITYSTSLFCLILLYLLSVSAALSAIAQDTTWYNGPILDMHLHAEAPFLSAERKRDILYNNAARFLRLSEEEVARHHAMVRQAEGER